MTLAAIITRLPRFEALPWVSAGTRPAELAVLQDQIIADLGVLWCDLVYGEQATAANRQVSFGSRRDSSGLLHDRLCRTLRSGNRFYDKS